MAKLRDMMEFLIPLHTGRKSNLVIGIGCTGGTGR